MTPRELRLGLIGCGNHGLALAGTAAKASDVRVSVTADVDETAARYAASELGARAASSPEEACASDEVDAVLVATPNYVHRGPVEAAIMAARKHVFCEKPMALTVEDCDAMLAAAESAGIKLMVGHMQRLFPLLDAVRRKVEGGTLGEPVAVSVARRERLLREPGWLREQEKVGGVLFQSAVHELDWLRSVFGEVRQVYASPAGRRIQPYLDFPDTVFSTLLFESGVVGSLHSCMSDHLRSYAGEINGTEGSLHFDLHRGEIRLSGGPVAERVAANGAEAGRGILDHFARWVLDDVPPPLTARDGRQAVAIACAADESIATGRPAEVSP